MRSQFDRYIAWVLIGLLLLLGLVIIVGNRIGLPAPNLTAQDGLIGSRGPIALVFSEPMLAGSVEERLVLDPPLQGRYTWQAIPGGREQMLSFWPIDPLPPDLFISIRLAAGAQSQSGLLLRGEYSWQVKVRQPEVVYLSTTREPELWLATLDGQPAAQLTQSGGRVFDFGVAPDGSQVIYSVQNEQNGFDLWSIDRLGSEPTLLLPCETDWCVNPAVSPDGQQLVYSRRQSGVVQGQGPGVPRLWNMDMNTLQTGQLYQDPNVGGFDPVWSPDGRYLAFFDGLSNGIRVMEVAARTDILLPSHMGMAGRWSPDSRNLLFTDYGQTDTGLFVTVFSLDVQTQAIVKILGGDVNQSDYSVPEWAPDGKKIAVALRLLNGNPGKQIWMMNPDGSQAVEITSDQLYTNASYHWAPSGGSLVFQQLEMNSSDQSPQVVVWSQEQNQFTVLAKDAHQPQWLP